MMNTDAKLFKVLDLLIQQTRSGKLRWKESYGDSFQASLAKQTIVVSNVSSVPALEIRDSHGDLVQKVGIDSVMDFSTAATSGVITNSMLLKKVEQLYSILQATEATKVNATLDNLLSELEK